MWRIAVLFTLALGALPAQIIGRPGLPPTLVSYLELTRSQQDQILQENQRLSTFNLDKTRRSSVVQTEIQMELAKADPDPMALGLRYRELEAIRRETAAEQSRTMQNIQTLLTAAQKQKLSTLQEALRLQSTACDAVNWNLTTAPPLVIGGILSTVPAPISSVLSFLAPSSGCGTPAIRTGDFTFQP